MKVPWSNPSLGVDEKSAVDKVFKRDWLSQGSEVENFENELKKYIGCDNVLCVNSGTTALMISLLAIKYRFRKRFRKFVCVVPSITFSATYNVPLAIGMDVEPIDVDSEDSISYFKQFLDASKNRLGNKFFIWLPVHLWGTGNNLIHLKLAAQNRKDVFILEDACQSLGAIQYPSGKKLGSNSVLSVFSFHMAKIISSVEGGCIATSSKSLYEDMKIIRNQGIIPNNQYSYLTKYPGINGRMTDINAAIGRVQLKKIDTFIKKRNDIYIQYKQQLENVRNIKFLYDLNNTTFSIVPILVKNPITLKTYLRGHGIDTRLMFPSYEHQNINYIKRKHYNLNNSNQIFTKGLMLPTGNRISKIQINYVCSKIKKFYERKIWKY